MKRKQVADMSEDEFLIQFYKDRSTLKLRLEKTQLQQQIKSVETDIIELKGFEKSRKDALKCDIILTLECWEKIQRQSLESSIETITLIDRILTSRGLI
jgi:hypothetical protein|tara:strand:+ start:7136 stop:7432 length:297 start_codon:yes stop_codon:yes gene_type:complete